MADDDDDVMPKSVDDFEEEVEEEVELDPGDLDEEDLDEAALEEDDAFVALDDDFVAEEEEEEDDTSGPVRRAVASEDEDEDDEMLAPDDVEADLDTILKDRMVAADDEDDEEEEPEERGEASDRLQPKRADEQLCPNCFLLVRQGAPGCPVGDDDCPLFK